MKAVNARPGRTSGYLAVISVVLGLIAISGGCSSGSNPQGPEWSNPLTGAPEPTSPGAQAQGPDAAPGAGISGNAGGVPGIGTAADGGNASTASPVGSTPAGASAGASIQWLITTGDLNLRTGPSTSYSILRVIPKGSLVQLLDPNPVNGFLHVDDQGLTGWASSAYLVVQNLGGDAGTSSSGASPSLDGGSVVADGGGSQATSAAIQGALDRAKAAVGFSYWWGHGAWLPTGPMASNAGSCSGSCPNCTHSGSYGADCSGYVAKLWEVPASNNDITVDSHPYSTADFVNDTSLWSTIPQGSVKLGDAFVYNQNGSGHIFMFSAGDPWGAMDVYECKGCSTGCVFDNRTAGSAYHPIRRAGY